MSAVHKEIDAGWSILPIPEETLEGLKPVIKFIQAQGSFDEGQLLVEFVVHTDGTVEIQANFLHPDYHLQIQEITATSEE